MNNHYKYFPYFLYIIFLYIASVGILIPKGSILTQIFGILFFIIPVSYNFLYVKKRYFNFIYLYLLFLIILILFLSDKYESSFKLFMKFSVSFLLFPIGFSLYNSESTIKKLFNILIIISILYIINILIANVLNLGGAKYSEDGLDTGNIFTEGLNTIAYIIVATPVILHFYPKRRIIILSISIVLFVLLVIQLKRISILSTLVGLFIFLIYYKKRSQALVGIIGALIVLVLLFPLYGNILSKQLESRESKLQVENLETEGRVTEFSYIMTDLNESNSKLFLGHNLFNSPGNYKNPFTKDRQIHNDYNALLHGSGIIGLAYFLTIQFFIFFTFIKIFKKVKRKLKRYHLNNHLVEHFRYLFPAFFIMGLIIMMSGGLYGYLFNAIRYLTLGSIIGYLFHLNHQLSHGILQNSK